MASITVSSNPSTTGNTLTVNFTTDATNISSISVSKDGGSTYQRAASFTSDSATFDVSNWSSGTYNNCILKCVYTEAGGGSEELEYIGVTLQISNNSKFNDINNDGLGEFEGWGTSLCWWANRLGYNKNLINQAVDKFYSPNGLDLNIGRYNIGGGDRVKETFHTPYYIDSTTKKVVYDLTTSGLKPEFFGTSMQVYENRDMAEATYSKDDSDFGIQNGAKVGALNVLGYISKLGDATGESDNVRYKVSVQDTGLYTLKLLMTYGGDENRDIALRINKISKYVVDSNTVNNSIVADNGSNRLYVITLNDIHLVQGNNIVDIGGNTGWCLDLVKMAVIRSKVDSYYSNIETPMNKNTDIYPINGYRKPTYSGTSMSVNPVTTMQDVLYTEYDVDLGLQKGNAVGTLEAIGYINKLGDPTGEGGNVTFTVNVTTTSDYNIRLLMTLGGVVDRDVGIQVNGTKYYMTLDKVKSSVIAQGNNYSLFAIGFNDTPLQAGENTITIGGGTTLGLDLVCMGVTKSSSAEWHNDFLHNSHINRSDSAVPGYAVDVTGINTTKHDINWYYSHFDRVDEKCGYAWNYDWDADRYQLNMTKAIAKAKGSDFIAEAFSNSPPYFMTISGCSSGATNSWENNLRENSYDAFAKYLADVIEHINKEDNGITFTSATGMNEPFTNYWGANSNKQEGCHFDQGDSQSWIIQALNWNLKNQGVNNCIISASDETSIDTAIESYKKLTQGAKDTISRIDTHTYSGSNREGLKSLAEVEGKNLWMSEVDGDFTAGTNAEEMSAPLGLAQRIIDDLYWMMPSAWILWDIVDMHTDTGNVHDGNDTSWLNTWGGYWGLTICDHDKEEIKLLKKYYAYGQFTRYIKSGYNIFKIAWNAIGAYDPVGHKVVIVAINTSDKDKRYGFSLAQFTSMSTDTVNAIRTSGSLADGENWADVSSLCDTYIDNNAKYIYANLKANSITTFIANNISYKTEGVKITIKNIDNMSVTKGEQFDVVYRTNIAAVKHEISWDGGNTYYDKTSEITSNGTTYTYKHDADIEHDSLFITIKVTDASNNYATTSFTVTQTIVTDPYREGRTLIWEDDFIGSSLSKNWDYENNYHRPNEVQNYVTGTNNVWVENSNLVIKAKRENSNGQSWTSGCIHTNDKQEFMYGRIEAKIKIPQTVGSFPAFWTLGGNYDEGWGINWPYCGEIDIMEHKSGASNITAGALYHTELLWDRWDVVSNLGRVDSGNIGSYDDYHIYSLEWTYNKIDYYVDDVLIGHSDISDDSKYFMFHQPHYMLLNLAIGAAGGTPPTDINEYTMYVDWVRVYAPEQAPIHGDTANWIWFEDTSPRTMSKWSKIGLVPKFNESWTNKVIWWNSSDTNIATVRGGRVDSKGVDGSCVITATTLEGNSASITVNVGNAQPTTLTISNISNITQVEKTEFYIEYSTNIAVTKHEVSWDGGNTFYDKTEDVTANGTNYKFKHDNLGSAGTYKMAIRVTDSDGNTKTSNIFTVTLSVNDEGDTYYSADFTYNHPTNNSFKIAEDSKTHTFTTYDTSYTIPLIVPDEFNGDLTWTSSDTSVAIVEEGGIVSPRTNGTCTIRITDGQNYNDTYEIKVNIP